MFFALILPLLVLAPAKPLDQSRLLRAIEAVEGGDPASRGGRACISEAVYRQHGSSFYRTTAFRHLRWIEEQVGPDVGRIALAWRWGVEGMKAHATDDYGERVRAIYEEAAAQEAAQEADRSQMGLDWEPVARFKCLPTYRTT